MHVFYRKIVSLIARRIYSVFLSGSFNSLLEFGQFAGVASGITATRHTVPDLDGEIYFKSIGREDRADVNSDGVVNILDLVIVANALGKAEPDLNGDGVVNVQDLVIVANAF